MFYNCKSLIYLNLYNFTYHTPLKKNFLLTYVPSDLKFCINDSFTIKKLLSKNRIKYLNCCDICFSDNKEVDINNKICLQSKGANSNKFCNYINISQIIDSSKEEEEEDENLEEEESEEGEEEKISKEYQIGRAHV